MNVRSLGLCLTLGIVPVCFVASSVAQIGCSSSAPINAGAPPKPIVIGVSNSLTGGLAGIGTPLQNAVKVAEQYINSSGGVLGRPVQFVALDDASDESDAPDKGKQAIDTINSLLAQGAVAVIGPNGSGQVQTVQDILYKAKVLQISATATSPLLSTVQPAHDRYFFRTAPPDDLQGRALADFAVLGPRGVQGGGGVDGGTPTAACMKLALFYYTNPYGTEMAKVVKQVFPQKSGGGQIVIEVTTDTSVKSDYTTEVGQIIAAKPDCLGMIIYDDVADAFMTNLTSALASPPTGWNPNFFIMGTDGVYTDAFIKNGRTNPADPNSPSVANNVYGTNPDTNPPTSDYNDFRNFFTGQFPLAQGATDVDAYASNEFDAAMVIALAIEAAGTADDHVKVRDAMYAISNKNNPAYGPSSYVKAVAALRKGNPIHYKGASGDLLFDDNGNVGSGYIVWHVNKGQFETLAHIKQGDL